MADDDAAESGAPGAAFAAFLKKGEIRLQVCAACGKQIFFPRTLCPYCGGDKLEWKRVSGRASVYSTTIVRQRPERGGDYNVSVIEFAEGARMLSRVEGVAPAEVKIGMAVEAAIADIDGAPQIVFTRPAAGRL
jgi:uncharacterized OB-fold protein